MSTTYEHPLIKALVEKSDWDYQEAGDGEHIFHSVDREFGGFESNQYNLKEVKQLFTYYVRSPSDDEAAVDLLFVEASNGHLFKGTVNFPQYRDDESDAQLSLTIHKDTPANRKKLIGEHCVTVAHSARDQVNALLVHAPDQLKVLLTDAFDLLNRSQRTKAVAALASLAPSTTVIDNDSGLER